MHIGGKISRLALSLLHVLVTATVATFKSRTAPPAGKPRPAAPTRCPVALGQATEIDRRGSILVGKAVQFWTGWQCALVIVKPATVIGLAPLGFSGALDLESSAWPSWQTHRSEGGARMDSEDPSQQSVVGRAPHPWGITQTRHRHRRDQSRQVYGAKPQAAVADLADLPGESRHDVGLAHEVLPGDYHQSRTHLSLGKDAPEARTVQPPEPGNIIAIPQVGGLHHRYERRAA